MSFLVWAKLTEWEIWASANMLVCPSVHRGALYQAFPVTRASRLASIVRGRERGYCNAAGMFVTVCGHHQEESGRKGLKQLCVQSYNTYIILGSRRPHQATFQTETFARSVRGLRSTGVYGA